MRREQRIDRIINEETARHPPARGQGVAEEARLEDVEKRGVHLPFLGALAPAIFLPDRRLFDEEPDIDDRERGKDPDHQQPAPADCVECQPVDQAGQKKPETPRTLQQPAHEPPGTRRPGFHRQSRPGRPLAPMPMPSSARNRNRNPNVGEKPAMKLQIEYHRIEIISGVLRPTRSASHPDAVAPSRRSHNVTVNTKVTSTSGTLNSLAIGTMINRKIVKSNESSVQP